jgi:non-ribosomal peptide synthetase component F
VPDPTHTEDDWLAAVERERAAVSPALTALVPADCQATVAELQAAVAYARRVEDWYLYMLGPAKALGFGRLAQRLNDVLAEVRAARATCEGMLLKRIAAQQAIFDSQPPPPDPVAAHTEKLAKQMAAWEAQRKQRQAEFDAWAEAHRKRQAAYDAQNQAWSDRFNKKGDVKKG